MSGGDSAVSHVTALERQMHRIQQNAQSVRINRAQCALLALRLYTIFETMCRLPDPLPSPQIFTVFRSADMLIQQMKSDGWKTILLRHFTCNRIFKVLFERMGKAWKLHQTVSWELELQTAVEKDEMENASLCVQLLQSGEKFSFSFCMFEGEKRFSADNASTLTEEQIINFFRRRQLSGWKLALEELTPPDVGSRTTTTTATKTTKTIPFVFNVHHGYRNDDTAVVLHMLEESEDKAVITPSTIAAFVQDMVSRSRWCHPNIVPFLGAFTEKTSSGSENATSSADASIPVLSLGFVTQDITRLTALCCEDGNKLDSSFAKAYVCLRPANSKAEMTHFSLYDALFVRRQRFTIKEAIGITLQVADALQYILMDKMDVPDEVATAWITVSPSNIFLCPANTEKMAKLTSYDDSMLTKEGQRPTDRDHGSALSNTWGMSQLARVNGKGDEENSSKQHRNKDDEEKKETEVEKQVCLPFTGKFSVMYSPPVYVEGGPFSRWRPHPHAASPASYVLTQLFIAIISNEPPYRAFLSQKDLATRVFDVSRGVDGSGDARGESNNFFQVKVSIPIGTAIPTFLPQELRQLCSRGLFLLHPSRKSASPGIELQDFIERMRSLYDTAMDVFCHVNPPTSVPRQLVQSADGTEVSLSTEPSCSVELKDFMTPLSDYGEISSNKHSPVVK